MKGLVARYVPAMRILHFAPHPDDEILGTGGALLRMARAGHEVVNFACSLGRREQQERRLGELIESCSRTGFTLRVAEPPVQMSSADDLLAAERQLMHVISLVIEEHNPEVVVAPSPHDNHHGHELVGRAVVAAIESAPTRALPLWLWEFWSRLDIPTLLVPLDEDTVASAVHAVNAHEGENRRADYGSMVRARAALAARAGFERVFGFGSDVDLSVPFAEELCEVFFADGGWHFGQARRFTDVAPVGAPGHVRADQWLHSPSVRSQLL